MIQREQPDGRNGAALAIFAYHSPAGPRSGLKIADQLYDLARLTGVEADAAPSNLIADWAAAAGRIRAAKPMADARLDDVALLAPLPDAGSIYGAGANYQDHALEMSGGSEAPPKGERSWHFMKSAHTVVGPGATVERPSASLKLDWEVELAAVIGRSGKDIALGDALDHVAGYTVAIDLSARDLSRRSDMSDQSPFKMDWVAHKNFDGACPLGPWIVPAWAMGDPQKLRLYLSVNGVMKQDSDTSHMIFSLAEQIRDISSRITLRPGDIILTGTPAGVGNKRGEFLQPGDQVVAGVDGIGEIAIAIA
jgi:2-keto-4-pentenoate hydratase/2-oxohepta-3-ene-1,7-dioic acid hydratase in catechol pathway